jgi:hypothetical protein
MARGASWFVAVAAFTLITVSLGSYFYHRRQLEAIAASHLRLVVAGPGQLRAGLPCTYSLLATTVTGEPCNTQVEWSLSTPDGKRLVDRNVPTDDQGRLTMVIPADMDLPTRSHGAAQLSVTAGGGTNPPSVSLPLPVRPKGYFTRLWLDRRRYRPGETIFYRSLSLSRFSLADRDILPLEFEILDPKSEPLPHSRLAGLTDRGVGNGSFRLPDGLPPGVYTLVARGWEDAFPEARAAFEVIGPAIPHSAPPNETKGKPTAASPRIEFFPEGGSLAAGIENRVYFAARDAKGQPLEIRGRIVDSKGASVANVDATRGGLGLFSFVPDAAETYRLIVTGLAGGGTVPAGFGEPLLPQASSEQKVAIAAGSGVIAAGAPLEFSIRAARDRIPLVITARLRGLPVGQHMMVTPSPNQPKKAYPISMPLDEQVAGVIQLTVYDCTKSPAQVLAERLVYRQPKRLAVRASEVGKPGREVALSIQNEKGRPIAAALGLAVVDGKSEKSGRPGRTGIDLLHSLIADNDLDNPALLENTNPDFSAAASDEAKAGPAAFNLILGCQRPLGKATPGTIDSSQPEKELPSLIIFDNLDELRAQYEAALREYRVHRTNVVNALIMLSFFGGLALALLVTMLALLRIVWGSRLWLPTAIALIGCIVVTCVSNEPSRMKPVQAAAVGFAPCLPAADEAPAETKRSGSNTGLAASSSSLRSLAEKLATADGDPEQLKSAQFAVQQYVRTDSAAAAVGDDPPPLAWYPLLIADNDGHVTLPGLVPGARQVLHLEIDAHSDGRFESNELTVK